MNIRKEIEMHEHVVRSFKMTCIDALEKSAALCAECLEAGNKILLCGNGGSAADSQHIAAEFVGRFMKERKGLPAIALTTDTSILTAIGNDYGYGRCISAPGRSPGQSRRSYYWYINIW